MSVLVVKLKRDYWFPKVKHMIIKKKDERFKQVLYQVRDK